MKGAATSALAAAWRCARFEFRLDGEHEIDDVERGEPLAERSGDGAGRIVNIASIVGFTGYSGVAVCAAAIRHGLTFDPVMIFKILVIPALTISNVGAVPLARHIASPTRCNGLSY